MKKIIGILVGILFIISYFGCIVNAEIADLEKPQIISDNNINYPPLFGVPSPFNGSIGNPLRLTWSIPIVDPEGNTFSYAITCSNGQKNSSISASNGTKSLSLSGLAYFMTYTVWVNATDPGPSGSGLYTRKWYTFTTISIHQPVIIIESIKGGIGVSAVVKNFGDANGTFEWCIVSDGLVFFNGDVPGETTLGPGESTTIKTGLMLGFGNINITITAGYSIKQANAKLIFFWVTDLY